MSKQRKVRLPATSDNLRRALEWAKEGFRDEDAHRAKWLADTGRAYPKDLRELNDLCVEFGVESHDDAFLMLDRLRAKLKWQNSEEQRELWKRRPFVRFAFYAIYKARNKDFNAIRDSKAMRLEYKSSVGDFDKDELTKRHFSNAMADAKKHGWDGFCVEALKIEWPKHFPSRLR